MKQQRTRNTFSREKLNYEIYVVTLCKRNRISRKIQAFAYKNNSSYKRGKDDELGQKYEKYAGQSGEFFESGQNNVQKNVQYFDNKLQNLLGN